jgi:hypothetical protein
LSVSLDGGIARRRDDPLVRRQEVVGEGVEVRDAPDQCRAGDEVVAVGKQRGEQFDIARVALDESVIGILVVVSNDPAVLGQVVDPDDFVATSQQLSNDIAANEAGRAGDQNL